MCSTQSMRYRTLWLPDGMRPGWVSLAVNYYSAPHIHDSYHLSDVILSGKIQTQAKATAQLLREAVVRSHVSYTTAKLASSSR